MTSIYQFKPEDAYDFARTQGIKTKNHGDELQFQLCPYCHGGERKDKYTFAISLKTGRFNCKRGSCSAAGNMITLSREFSFSLGREVDAYYRTADYTTKQFRAFQQRHIEPKPEAIAYLERRGIPEKIIKQYEITSKEDGKILIFSFRDEDGMIQFVKYRNTAYVPGVDKSKEWCEKDCKPILYGMDQCTGAGTLVITEGQIDSLSCTAAGIPNAVSVPTGKNGFTWVPYCWDFIAKYQVIVVFGDNENGHITLAEELAARWPDKVRVVQPEDYQGCKDANDLLREHGTEALKSAVANAKRIADDRIKRVADVESKDISKIPGIQTGIESLDQVLDGRLRLGQLVILTGRRGNGKSTFGSMLAVHAINQGFKTFFYSGELTDYMFRNWMDRQVAGRDIKLTEDKTSELMLRIDQFYGDKAFLFDNNFLTETSDKPEQEAILDATEIAVTQYGCQLVIIDNLMAALTARPQDDIYRAQSEFVGKLVRIVKRYNIILILIAHPRKTNGDIENDDISGSADITNKADIVMDYGKPKPKTGEEISPDARVLRVTKNRMSGVLTGKDGISLVFDAKSKRIAEKTHDFLAQSGKFNFLPVELNERQAEAMDAIFEDGEIPPDEDEEQ